MLTQADVRDSHFSRGVTCPRCQSTAIRWYGRDKRGNQRYRCNGCKRTFVAHTGTPMARTWYPDKWEAFAQCMREHDSCRKVASKLRINHKTAWAWRHKVVAGLSDKTPSSIGGFVEADETYVVRSYKGSRDFKRGLMPRKPRKRGPSGGAISRGLGKDQVAVMVMVNREASVVSGVVDQMSKDSLLAAFGSVLEKGSVLCSDGSLSIGAFARALAVEHHTLNLSKKERVRGVYHVQHVSSYHSRFKDWLRPFHGVSTKYLPSYVRWHQFADADRRMVTAGERTMLLQTINPPTKPQEVVCPKCGTKVPVPTAP
ncbi:MAG TPA: IS1595 family transposase [Chloroflexota bacterium]|nr:IS1595 family transposase [Chloroflexota bacterium]